MARGFRIRNLMIAAASAAAIFACPATASAADSDAVCLLSVSAGSESATGAEEKELFNSLFMYYSAIVVMRYPANPALDAAMAAALAEIDDEGNDGRVKTCASRFATQIQRIGDAIGKSPN